MSLNLDNQPAKERTMNYVRQARLGTTIPVDFPLADEQPHRRPANDRIRRAGSRTVLGGCAILLSIIAVWSTVRALELRPLSTCHTSPVRLTFGAATAAVIDTSSGGACAIAVNAGSATVEDLTVTSAAQHGSITPRGRTGVIYRSQAKYRGEDRFELALRGRAGGEDGVAIVRVRVNVK